MDIPCNLVLWWKVAKQIPCGLLKAHQQIFVELELCSVALFNFNINYVQMFATVLKAAYCQLPRLVIC